MKTTLFELMSKLSSYSSDDNSIVEFVDFLISAGHIKFTN